MLARAAPRGPRILWDRTYGGSNHEDLTEILPTADGGYLLGGRSASGMNGNKTAPRRGDYDYWVVKIDAQGAVEWDRTYGGSYNLDNPVLYFSQADLLTSLVSTADGGYLLGGKSMSPANTGNKTAPNRGSFDYWVVKIDAQGVLLWDRSYGGSSDDELTALVTTADGGYLLGGRSTSPANTGNKTAPNRGSFDYWVVKIDAQGAVQWDSTYGGSSDDEPTALVATANGGYLLGGTSGSEANTGNKTAPKRGSDDYWLVQINGDGVLQWDRTYGGTNHEELTSLVATTGGYLLGGKSGSGMNGNKTAPNRGSWDYWVVKINDIGVLQWDRTYGGAGYDELYSLVATDDGYLLGGVTFSSPSGNKTAPNRGGEDYWVVKIDAQGAVQWDSTYGGTDYDMLHSIVATTDGGYLLGGRSQSFQTGNKTAPNRGASDYWLVRLQGCEAPAAPTFAATTASACLGSNVSFTNTRALNPVEKLQVNTANAATGWVDVTGDVSFATASTDQVRYVRIWNGSCPSEVVILTGTAVAQPAAPVLADQARQGAGSVQFTYDGTLEAGQQLEWSSDNTSFGNPGTTSPAYTLQAGEAATFYARITSNHNCTGAVASVKATAYAVNSSVQVVQTAGSNSLSAPAGVNTATIQWLDANLQAIVNATGVTFTPTANGTYYVSYRDANGDYQVSNAINFVAVTTSRTASLAAGGIQLYPNPSPGQLNVALATPGSYSLQLTDLQGRVVYTTA
ncbi:MAG: T9SS type A sorting domain-containing protein, partial [Bacteroidetes bacterium]|nr:T9SS type A sorting domain-containing protein [Bacteroidota bacterium]